MSESLMLCLMSTAPEALHRAQRLDFAIHLIRQRVPTRIIRRRIQDQYGCSYRTAYETIEMARDLVA